MGAPSAATRQLNSGVEWATPDGFFQGVAARFGPFDLDAAATAENAKAPTFYSVEDNGLRQPWRGRVWCNPPYLKDERACKEPCHKKGCAKRGFHLAEDEPGLPGWAAKAASAVACEGADLVAFLVPVATETRWWVDHIFTAAEIHYVTPCLRFNDGGSGGTLASALVIWRRGHAGPPSFHLMGPDGGHVPWPGLTVVA